MCRQSGLSLKLKETICMCEMLRTNLLSLGDLKVSMLKYIITI
jgi:hypothetical protein